MVNMGAKGHLNEPSEAATKKTGQNVMTKPKSILKHFFLYFFREILPVEKFSNNLQASFKPSSITAAQLSTLMPTNSPNVPPGKRNLEMSD